MRYLMKSGDTQCTVEAASEEEAQAMMGSISDQTFTATELKEPEPEAAKAGGPADPRTAVNADEPPNPTHADGYVMGTHFGGFRSGGRAALGPAHNAAGPNGIFERNMRPTQQGTVDATTGMGPAKMRAGDLVRRPAGILMPQFGPPLAHASQAIPEPGRYIGDGAEPVTENPDNFGRYTDPRDQPGSIQYAGAHEGVGPVVTQQMIDDGTAPDPHPVLTGSAEDNGEQSPGSSDKSPAQSGRGRTRNGRQQAAA